LTIESFEKELQQLNKDFVVIKNKQAQGLATVFLFGEPIFAIPANGIYDTVNGNYGIELPTGTFVRHRTRPEALQQAKNILDRMKDPDYMDALLGRGKYSNAELNGI